MPNIIISKEWGKSEKGRLIAESLRKREDINSGLTRGKGAQRGDYKICRELDKINGQLSRFKDPRDKAKITNEYYGREKEYRESQQKKLGYK